MLVAHLVAPQPGETIVDLCAAPGGKTTHLAQLMKDEGRIFALDNHPHKTRLIEENAARLGITSITAVTADAREWRGDNLELDVVLLDAPCTGTGFYGDGRIFVGVGQPRIYPTFFCSGRALGERCCPAETGRAAHL